MAVAVWLVAGEGLDFKPDKHALQRVGGWRGGWRLAGGSRGEKQGWGAGGVAG